MKPNKSNAAEYATHGISLMYGPCWDVEKGHGCTYCYNSRSWTRNQHWNQGDLRLNERAYKMADGATPDMTVMVQFTGDPFPTTLDQEAGFQNLKKLLDILERRCVPTKVLTKNANIVWFAERKLEPYIYVQLGHTLSTNIGNWITSARCEPKASPLAQRAKSLQELHKKGWRTWVSGEPILPNTDIKAYLMMLDSLNIEEVYLGRGNHFDWLDAFDWQRVIEYIDNFKWTSQVKVGVKHQLAKHRSKEYESPQPAETQ